MNKSFKFYIFLVLFTSLVFVGSSQSNFYENTVASSVCEGDTNIIKAGCSIAVGQIVRVTPGIVTGVTLDKMGDCYNKYGKTTDTNSGKVVVVDLNDPCNQIASLNPTMEKEKYAFIPFNEDSVFTQSRPGIASLGTMMEVGARKATNGMLMSNSYYAANTFKNVPYLKTVFAQGNVDRNGILPIASIVYNIWLVTRNLAYLILLAASLVLGIIIMLGTSTVDRDGKIKLSVERAIPRVIVCLILISSSYWIGDLVFNTLLNGGIVQGFATFMISTLLNQNIENPSDVGIFLSYSLVVILMGTVAALTVATAGGVIIPVIFGIVFVIYRFLLINYFVIRNIISLLVFIVISPLVLVRGVQASRNYDEVFRMYFSRLLYFIIAGFGFNLIIYGSKAVLVLGTQTLIGDPSSLASRFSSTFFGTTDVFASGSVASTFLYLFSIIACYYILGLTERVEARSHQITNELTGVNNQG